MNKAKNYIPACLIKYNRGIEKNKLKRERKQYYKQIQKGKQLTERKSQRLNKIEEIEPILDQTLATDPEKEIEPIHDQTQATDPEKESYMKLRLQCDPLPFEIESPTSSRHYKKEIHNNKFRFRCMNSDEEYNFFEYEDWKERDEIAKSYKYQERIKNE